MTNVAPASDNGDWPGHERPSRAYQRIMLGMFCGGFAIFAQLYSPQAVLPEISAAFSVDAPRAALMVSLGTLGVALSVLPWSLIADRIGRVHAMAWSICLAVAFSLLTVTMPSFELSLAARLLEGFAMGGVPAVAHAYLNEELHPSAAPAAAGVFVSGNTAGGMSGRLIAAPLGEQFGWQFGSLGVTAVAAVMALLFLILTPPAQGFTPPDRHELRFRDALREALANIRTHLNSRRLVVLYTLGFLLMGGFVATYNYLGYRLTAEPYNLPSWIVGSVFLAYLAGTLSSPIAGRYAAAQGRKRTVLIGCGIMALGLIITLGEPLWMVIVGLLVLTAGLFAAHSVTSGWAGSMPRSGKAQSTALYNLGYYAGSSTFGFIGGLAFVTLGWPGLVLTVLSLILAAIALTLFVLPWRPQGFVLGQNAL